MSGAIPAYPDGRAARDAWVASLRPHRSLAADPFRARAAFVEDERDAAGGVVPVATLLLTGRECPWRCVMCDLWQGTVEDPMPPGAVPAQIRGALAGLPEARAVKLYNHGSFFDPRSVPPEDHQAIADLVRGFATVVVESHPSLVDERAVAFRDRLEGPRLEVAIGLETAHPETLERLNKGMTVDGFRRAASFLAANDVALRVFVLVAPPFLPSRERRGWTRRSVDEAFEAGAMAVSLIPTRGGNGAMEAMRAAGEFEPPLLVDLEDAVDEALLDAPRGRVFADLWDAERLAGCDSCFAARVERLRRMNLTQSVLPGVACPDCA